MTTELRHPGSCKCGETPAVTNTLHGRINVLRIECQCGKKGAALFYTNPRLEGWARQAAIDGWDLRL